MLTVSAPGKMILLGEYAVLEDAPALVCAVNKRALVQIKPLPTNEFVFSAPSLHLSELPFVILTNGHVRFDPALAPEILRKLQLFSGIVEFTFQHFPPETKQKGLHITITTDAFYSHEFRSKMGFGSSAALCVALVQALVQAYQLDFSAQQVFRLALNAHHFAQGKMGSGIDIAASFFGGFLEYHRVQPDDPLSRTPKRLEPCPGLHFKAVFTGKSASTTKLVGGVQRLKNEQPATYAHIMNTLKQISTQGVQAFKNGQTELFLSQVRQFYQTLQNLGQQSGMPIISEVHQTLARLAEEAGTVYKPSGAGSGDIGLVFSASEQKLEQALNAIKNHGYIPLNVDVTFEGVRLEKSF